MNQNNIKISNKQFIDTIGDTSISQLPDDGGFEIDKYDLTDNLTSVLEIVKESLDRDDQLQLIQALMSQQEPGFMAHEWRINYCKNGDIAMNEIWKIDEDGHYEIEFNNGWHATIVQWPRMEKPVVEILNEDNETKLQKEMNYKLINENCLDDAVSAVKIFMSNYVSGMNSALGQLGEYENEQ